MVTPVRIGRLHVGRPHPLVLIAGPCAVESRDLVLHTAETLVELCRKLAVPLIFKSSYKKANRSSAEAFTTIGEEPALEILADVKRAFDVPILTDIHTAAEAARAAAVADVLQIPAFLCRQTELLEAAARTGRAVNIKKGQFMAPEEMRFAADKVRRAGSGGVLLTERGVTFGYHELVVDFRALPIMRATGHPVVFDATHAVQIPSQGGRSGGRREFVAPLARAAAAVGIDALFLETHPEPARAVSDADSQLPLGEMEALLSRVLAIDRAAQ